MGNRSYLYLKNPQTATNIFEANNSLPFFWLSLIDRDTLKRKLEDWKKFEQYEGSHTEEETEKYLEHNSNDIAIDKQTFVDNSKKSRIFFQKHFPNVIPLFDDFIHYIEAKLKTDDSLQMDMIQFSGFYNSLTDFYNAIDNELQAIEDDNPQRLKFPLEEDLIAHGTGFETTVNQEFSFLPSYQEAIAKRATPKVKQSQKFNKKSLIISIVLLLLCPIFSFITYKMYEESGFTFNVALIGIVNFGFYYFSIWSIAAEIKAYQKSRE